MDTAAEKRKERNLLRREKGGGKDTLMAFPFKYSFLYCRQCCTFFVVFVTEFRVKMLNIKVVSDCRAVSCFSNKKKSHLVFFMAEVRS